MFSISSMAHTRFFFALLLGILSVQGVKAVKYCFCEASQDFYYLGIEEQCKQLGGNWGPVNCDLGSSDVCKFSGDGTVDEAATKPLDEWCQSKDRTGTDLTGKVVAGGKLVCTDTKPDWVEDSCPELGEEGFEADEAVPPMDLGDEAETGDDSAEAGDDSADAADEQQTTQRLTRRAASGASDFLLYSPNPENENLVKTFKKVETKKYPDGSRENFYQITELRLTGYEWKLVRSYDNKEGAVNYTEAVELTYGYETTSGFDVKAELKVNFGYSGFGASFGLDASLSSSYFSTKKEQGTSKRTDSFFVPMGTAFYLYQKVYKWESTVSFRLVSTGPPFERNGKDVRGSWTVSTEIDEPLTTTLEFDVLANEKVVKRDELSGSGTFKVADKFSIKKPLYSLGKSLSQDDWSDFVRDNVNGLGFKL